ncbi:MAG: RnfABCDGE type electron transport complex subunit G [Clostridiales bacterium]|jgi:electron transport complex protein RnfG|nr:RnfABCDGE type electron transport complex subunit G [Clostridiales bacterium]
MQAIIKPAAALLIITLVAAAILGFVHDVTLEPIAQSQMEIEAAAIRGIFPAADKVQEIEGPLAIPNESSVSRGADIYSKGQLIGVAVYASPTGYAGKVSLVVGFDASGAIAGLQILSHSETPGLGANATQPSFTSQFEGREQELSVAKGSPKENEIQALTSATITSSAVVKGANDARAFFSALEGAVGD